MLEDSKKELFYEDDKRYSFLYDKRIICVFWKKGIELNREAAEATMEYALKNYSADGRLYPTMVEMSEIESFTKEAREVFQNKNTLTSSALALVVSSMLSRVMGNLFISMNQSGIPVKLFNNQEQALLWLESYAQ